MTITNTKKNHFSSPLVVSTDCSRFKSFYLTCRRGLSNPKSSIKPSLPTHPNTSPTNAHSSNCIPDGRSAAEAYWRRVNQLEMELLQLDKWLNIEKDLRDCFDSNKLTHCAEIYRERANIDHMESVVMRLVDGSYIYEMKKTRSEDWERLAMQVSAPAIVPMEAGSTIPQVLRRMAFLGRGKLRSWLLESMPMDDIKCRQKEKIRGNPVQPGCGKGFMEDIVLAAMEKMEALVLQGLRLQAGKEGNDQNVWNKREERAAEVVILVMLIQVRDPEKECEAVGDFMIGLVEVSVSEAEENGFHVEGIHVAGMSASRKDSKQSLQTRFSSDNKKTLGRRRDTIRAANYLWSVSATDCKGRCNCHCLVCVRNPDIMFAS